MKHFFTTLVIIFSTSTFAQVGVQTNTLQAALHANGSVRIEGELLLGGDAQTKGSAGTGGINGDFVVSQGENKAPIWGNSTDINIPTLVYAGHSDVVQTIPSKSSNDPAGNYLVPIGYFTATYLNSDIVAVGYYPPYQNTVDPNISSPDTNPNNNLFEIKKTGYYLISFDAAIDADPGGGTTTTSLVILKPDNTSQTISNSNPISGDNGSVLYSDINTVVRIESGSRIYFLTYYTREIRVSNKDLSISFLYQ